MTVVRDPERLLVDVALGRPKPDGLSPEESEFWDQLEVEVAEIERRGGMVDIPSGLPEADPAMVEAARRRAADGD